jgi:hypothetical protein
MLLVCHYQPAGDPGYGSATNSVASAPNCLTANHGVDHPDVANAIVNNGNALQELGGADTLRTAIQLYDQLIPILTTAYGADHPEVAGAIVNKSETRGVLGLWPSRVRTKDGRPGSSVPPCSSFFVRGQLPFAPLTSRVGDQATRSLRCGTPWLACRRGALSLQGARGHLYDVDRSCGCACQAHTAKRGPTWIV